MGESGENLIMSCFVYIIRSGKTGPYKIGVSHDVDNRMMFLQIGNPEKLYKIAAIDFQTMGRAKVVERQLHKMYKRARIRGEWFNSTIRLRRADDFFNTYWKEDSTWQQQRQDLLDADRLERREMEIVKAANARF